MGLSGSVLPVCRREPHPHRNGGASVSAAASAAAAAAAAAASAPTCRPLEQRLQARALGGREVVERPCIAHSIQCRSQTSVRKHAKQA